MIFYVDTVGGELQERNEKQQPGASRTKEVAAL